MSATTEYLTQAADKAESTRTSLIAANRTADPVAGLLLLQLIGKAATLANEIKALQAARQPQ